MAERETTRRLLRGSALTGGVAAVLGAITVASFAHQINGFEEPLSPLVLSSVGGKAMMVIAQAVLYAGWAAFAAAAANARHPYPLAVAAALGKVLSSVSIIAFNWSDGWEHILGGPHHFVHLMLLAAGIMDVLLLTAVFKRDPAPTSAQTD